MAKKKKKTVAKLKHELQKIFNKYIRLRDLDGHYFTCLACGEVKPKEVMNAGHFYAVKGYDSLRFNEDNVHGECVACNCFNESHLIGYAINLKNKIGEERVDDLHILARAYKQNGFKWYRDDLEEMIKDYKEKVKKLSY
jgi:hypothetical protein